MIIPSTGKVSYRFTLGEFTCISVYDGHASYPAKMIFYNAPPDELQSELIKRNIPDNKISIPFRCLLVQSGDNNILFDTGPGSDTSQTAGHLLDNLRNLDISPDDIETVVFSHGHIDHIGGAVDKEGNLNFPNARHLMGRQEFMFWLSDLAIDMAGESMTMGIREKLKPLQNKLKFIDPNQEIQSGIRSFAAPGHTPFSLGFVLQSENRKAYYISHSLTHPIHLEKPDWYMQLDLNPVESLHTRERILQQASKENSLIIPYHFPYPGVGYIHSNPDGKYNWAPLS